jgi:hypothetical protein
MQVVLEFMDKSLKGLVSGDLSVFALTTIKQGIDKHLPKMEVIQNKID